MSPAYAGRAGGSWRYGPNLARHLRRAAGYVDKI